MRISDWSSDVCSSDLLVFDSVAFDVIFAAAPDKAGMAIEFLGVEWDALTVLAILLFIGAMGKSAQIGLPPRLPDAKIGRAACRERVCQYGEISGVAV